MRHQRQQPQRCRNQRPAATLTRTSPPATTTIQAQMQRMQARKLEEEKKDVKEEKDEDDALDITDDDDLDEPTESKSKDRAFASSAAAPANTNPSQQQPESEKKLPLVHHSLYKPPPYRPRPEPPVHHLIARTRPQQTRHMLPVDQVFRPPVCNLWRSKFHSFNNLQSEVAQALVNSDDNILVSAPTGADKTAVFLRWPWDGSLRRTCEDGRLDMAYVRAARWYVYLLVRPCASRCYRWYISAQSGRPLCRPTPDTSGREHR